MTTELCLQVADLHKSFGHHAVLNGVNLEVNRGEVVVLLGRSGSGKSTLLRCIHLLEDFEKGLITLCGQQLGYRYVRGKRRRIEGREIAKQRARIGMVFQHFGLFSHLSVMDNVIIGPMRVQGLTRREAISRAEPILQEVGMWEKRDAYPLSLSGGQQQRVGIARALAMNPCLVLFDEPTSALDPELVQGILELMKRIASDGMTMIVVTHEIAFARDVGTKAVFMEGGIVVEEGHPDQVFTRPQHPETEKFLASILRQEAQ